MKLLSLARALGVAFALVLVGVGVGRAVIPTPLNETPQPGPWLGDTTINLNALWTAIINNNGSAYQAGISASQTSGQANCTQLTTAMSEVKTSASTGYVCLPTAYAGREIFIANPTTQTINIYSSATSFTPGTTDNINGTAGTSAYAGLTTGKNTQCFSPSNGNWYCGSAN